MLKECIDFYFSSPLYGIKIFLKKLLTFENRCFIIDLSTGVDEKNIRFGGDISKISNCPLYPFFDLFFYNLNGDVILMLKLNVMVSGSHLEELKAVMSEYGINNNNACICTDVYNAISADTVFITVYFDDMVCWDWIKVCQHIESVKTVRVWVVDDNASEYDNISFCCSMWYHMVKAGCEFGLNNCIAVKNDDPFKPIY